MACRFHSCVVAVALVAVGFGAAGCNSDGTYKLSWTFPGDGETSALTCARRGVFSIRVAGASAQGDHQDVEVPCAPGLVTRQVPAGTWTFTVLGLDREGCYRGNKALDVDAGVGPDAAMMDAGQAPDGDAGVSSDAEAGSDGGPPADGGGGMDGDGAAVDAEAGVDDGGIQQQSGALSGVACAGVPMTLGALSASAGPIEIVKDATASLSVTLTPLPTCADGVDNDGNGRVDLDDPVCMGNPRGAEAATPDAQR